MGTELAARGVVTRLPLWSAAALEFAPDIVREVHAAYAAAGADVHTTNTFRTQPRYMGRAFRGAALRACQLAREAVGDTKVAGSIAPIEDCYRPDLSPWGAGYDQHRALAATLAEGGVDLLLVETFPSVAEALVALRAARDTGLPVWVSLTAGPDADLLSPEAVFDASHRLREEGAAAVLVNCIPATRSARFVDAIRGTGLPFGAYANAGSVDDAIGWRPPTEPAVERYVAHAMSWVREGASIVGSCCGTGPAHVAGLRAALDAAAVD